MYSYRDTLALECVADSIEQLNHCLKFVRFFFYFIYASHLTFVRFSSWEPLFGWYSTIALLRKRWWRQYRYVKRLEVKVCLHSYGCVDRHRRPSTRDYWKF